MADNDVKFKWDCECNYLCSGCKFKSYIFFADRQVECTSDTIYIRLRTLKKSKCKDFKEINNET